MKSPFRFPSTCLTLFLTTLCLGSTVQAADDLPAGTKFIPADSAFLAHIDVATLYDSKLGDSIRKSDSVEFKAKLDEIALDTGLKFADIQTFTFVVPNISNPGESTRTILVYQFRKAFDRAKVIDNLKQKAAMANEEFSEKNDIVRLTSKANVKRTTLMDLSDQQRLIVLNDLPETFLKPVTAKSDDLLASTIQRTATASVVLGLNIQKLPVEVRGPNVPDQIRPFVPIIKAETLSAVGTLQQEKMELTVRVRSKDKTNAIEVEKAFGAFQTLLAVAMPQAKSELVERSSDPKIMTALLDSASTIFKNTKFAVDDKETLATLSSTTDLPIRPLLETLLGSGGGAARMQSQNNLKQLALAMHNFESANGLLPPAATLGKKGKKLHSWRVAILPYIEEDNLYRKFKHDEPWDSDHNKKVFEDNPMPKVFALPDSKNLDEKKTHFQVFVGSGAMFETVAALKISDIQDGTSNTILIATAANAVEWTKPDDIEFDPKVEMKKFLLFKNSTCSVSFADGAIRAISEKKITEAVLKALITRNGGEVIENDF
jgi:hypothetical protein